jgi:hypothetical protein
MVNLNGNNTRRSAMTEINSDRVNTLKEKFTFTYKRFVEYHNQRIIDQLIKQRKKGSFDIVVSKLKTPLSLSELNIAWSFYEDNFEILEDLVFNTISENYIDAHTIVEEKSVVDEESNTSKIGGN